MTEPIDNDRLKAEFSRLRETEARAAPSYRQLLAGADTVRPDERWRPSVRGAMFATAASVAALVLAITLMSGRHELTNDTAPSVPTPGVEAEWIVSIDMPTDFLLDTPWFELASTTPDFNLDIPQYDFPEESSDEI